MKSATLWGSSVPPPGSAKPTLLNRLVAHPAAGDCAVIVNEFGPGAIDHALVRTASENIVLLPSGCVCCQVAGDLVQAMRDLYFKRAAGEIPDFRRAIIETTGLADPAPLARTLIELPLVAARYSLSGIVTTVDGTHGLVQLDTHPEAVKQAAVADRLVITKCDLATAAQLDALEERLQSLNPGAPRLRSSHGDADPARLLDTGLYQGAGRLANPRSWLNAGAYRRAGDPLPTRHDPHVRAFAWFAEAPVEWPAFEDRLATPSAYRGQMKELAPLINEVARSVPKLRMRKLHIGLFGYSRSIEGITLPRVISFCASLYSIGLPAELLVLHNLTEKDLVFLKTAYPSFLEDLSLAASYYNGDVNKLISPKMAKDIEKVLGMVKYTENLLHREYTSQIIQAVLSGKKETVSENVIAAGKIRRFLG